MALDWLKNTLRGRAQQATAGAPPAANQSALDALSAQEATVAPKTATVAPKTATGPRPQPRMSPFATQLNVGGNPLEAGGAITRRIKPAKLPGSIRGNAGAAAGAAILGGAIDGITTSNEDYRTRLGMGKSEGALGDAVAQVGGTFTDIGKHAINALPNTVGEALRSPGELMPGMQTLRTLSNMTGVGGKLLDAASGKMAMQNSPVASVANDLANYDYGKNKFADVQAKAATKQAVLPPAAEGAPQALPAGPVTPTPSVAPTPAATAPVDPNKAFAAPDGAAVTSKDYTRADGKVDSIRKVVDEQGNTTYTNAKTYGDMQSSFAQGSVVPAFTPSAPAAQAPQNTSWYDRNGGAPAVASIGGDGFGLSGKPSWMQPGAAARESLEKMATSSPRAKYRAMAAQALTEQANRAEIAQAELESRGQIAGMQNAATLRGQDVTARGQDLNLQAHRESNAASKNNHEITALRQMAMDQYKMGRDRQEDARNAQADGRANAAAFDARSKANRERIAAAFSTYDAKTSKSLPNDALAAEAEAAFANMPQDMASKYKSKNFHDYDADTQNRFVAAHALSRQLAADKSKWGVTATALPTAHEIFNNANLVQAQPDGSIKIGASNKVNGGMMPWYDLSASDVQRNYAPYVRYLTQGR